MQSDKKEDIGKQPYPYLCGGIFFSLTLYAKKQYPTPLAKTLKSRGGSASDAVLGLIRVFNPEYKEPGQSDYIGGFEVTVNNFKSCKLGKSEKYLRFAESNLAVDLGSCDDDAYLRPLERMRIFVENLIYDSSNKTRCEWLVKALIELIKKDETIPDDQNFYVRQNHKPVQKANIHFLNEICLPAFLLGVWHYIISCDRNNKQGARTYEEWFTKSEKPGDERKFIGDIGCSDKTRITITIDFEETIVTSNGEFHSTLASDSCKVNTAVFEQGTDFSKQNTSATPTKSSDETKLNSLSSQMLEVFERIYNDCRIADFLRQSSSETLFPFEFDEDLLPWVDRFIDDVTFEMDLLCKHSEENAGSKAMCAKICLFIGTLRKYKEIFVSNIGQWKREALHKMNMDIVDKLHTNRILSLSRPLVSTPGSQRESFEYYLKRLAVLHTEISDMVQ